MPKFILGNSISSLKFFLSTSPLGYSLLNGSQIHQLSLLYLYPSSPGHCPLPGFPAPTLAFLTRSEWLSKHKPNQVSFPFKLFREPLDKSKSETHRMCAVWPPPGSSATSHTELALGLLDTHCLISLNMPSHIWVLTFLPSCVCMVTNCLPRSRTPPPHSRCS